VLSLVQLLSLVMDPDLLLKLDLLLQDDSLSFDEKFRADLKSLYGGKGRIWVVIQNYVKHLVTLFKAAQAKEPEYLNPSFGNVFSLNFPKLSALYSLPLFVYMTGGLQFTDTSTVFCIVSLLFVILIF
jgi:hypothetical protein